MTAPPSLHQRLGRAVTGAAALRAWRVLLVLLIVVVSYLALAPKPPTGVDLGWDKLNHMMAFTALAFAASLGYPAPMRVRVLSLAGLLAFGGLIEILQLYVPGRSAEWGDLLADAIGIVLGVATAAAVLRAATLPSAEAP